MNISQGARASLGRRLEPAAKRSFERKKFAAGDVGDGRGVILRAAVGDQDLADEAGGRARDQGGQRRQQRPFGILRWE